MSPAPDPTLTRRAADRAVARLATVRPDGSPHLVPITFAVEADRIVTAVDHKPKTTTALRRIANIHANPAVSVLFDHYEADWTRLWWARADGAAEVVDAGSSRHARACDLLAAKYAAYRQTRPAGPAIVIAVERWTTWSA